MNAVSFKFGLVPYLNISAGGSETWLDWTVAVFGEIFIDQKFMGLFSLLFGAGVMLFIERATARGGRAVLLNLWRNALLFLIGFLHVLLWEGDILMVYAVSSLFLVAMRNLAPRTLVVIGAVLFLAPIASDILLQSIANATDATLAGVWTTPGAEIDDTDRLLALGALFSYFMRGLGMIVMGAGLYRIGFMNGGMSSSTYRRVAIVGAGIGLPLAALGVVFVAVNDFSNGVAFIGNTPNNLGVIPASLGYMSLIILWNQRPDNWLKRSLRSVGRMALTNYLTQTVLGGSDTHGAARRRYGKPVRNPALRPGGLGATILVVGDLACPVSLWSRRMAMARCDLSPVAAVTKGMSARHPTVVLYACKTDV